MRKEGVRRNTICLGKKKETEEQKKEARKKRADTKVAVIQYLEDLIRKLRDEAVKEM